MLVFPQLGSGASALYPVRKKIRHRTVANVLASGAKDVFGDADGGGVAWEMRASGLTGDEAGAIEALFQAAGGMWSSFTFLDPVGNLLLQSENFGATAWTNGALIQLTTGIDDPLGTTRATRVVNAGSAAEAVAQSLSVPGSFQYCLSVWARSAGGSHVTLVVSTTGGSASREFVLNGEWARIEMAAKLGLATDSVTFGAQLEAGGSVDLFGMQVEAQGGASDYKRTGAKGGVHAKARFGDDRLTITAQGTDVFDAVIRIVDTQG
jgi:hypothetical protein